MKKLRIFLLSLAWILGLSLPCLADPVQGLVESIDSSNHSIMIKDPVSGSEKTVYVHPKIISEIKKGSVVKATLQSGGDRADTFEVIVAR